MVDASPRSLSVTAASSPEGIAPALHVKVVLSSKLSGDMVRILVKGDWLPDNLEIWTRSVLLTNGIIPLSQVMEMVTKLSKTGSTAMLQVKIKGVVIPEYEISVVVDTVTEGVGTEWRELLWKHCDLHH